MTYTITCSGAIDRGLTARDVMEHILSSDGHLWEIRAEPSRIADHRLYQVYRSTHSANSPMGARDLIAHGKIVAAASPEEAHDKLSEAIVADFRGWRGFHGEVMTDAEYDRLVGDAE